MAAQENSGWCTILSDPAVFTELLTDIGVKGLQVEELYSLDRSCFDDLGTIYGLVFLFRYRDSTDQNSAEDRPGKLLDPAPPDLFFAKQVIHNACATQAILSIVLNCNSIDVGPELTFFRDFTSSFSPTDRGLAISNSERLRSCHNAFASQHQFVIEDESSLKDRLRDENDDVPYHFVAYLPVNGNVYELDGLQPGPRDHGTYGGSAGDWLDVVTPVIAARMAEYRDEGEIRFTLLAVVEDVPQRLAREFNLLPTDAIGERAALQDRMSQETAKRAQWKRDNARRKFNFVPFIVEMLKGVASAGLIDDVIERATDRRRSQNQAAANKDKSNNS